MTSLAICSAGAPKAAKAAPPAVFACAAADMNYTLPIDFEAVNGGKKRVDMPGHARRSHISIPAGVSLTGNIRLKGHLWHSAAALPATRLSR